MKIADLRSFAANKTNFLTLGAYFDFAQRFLDFRAKGGFQAEIVAQNEQTYRFFQYQADAGFQVTRPVNSALYYDAGEYQNALVDFVEIFRAIKEKDLPEDAHRPVIGRVIYTTQQSIGAALDALPAGFSNTARKVNGDLFERFIRLLVNALGIDCKAGVLRVPVLDEQGNELLTMSYQHDLMVAVEGELKAIGSVKTSSKDRIDKIFIDKFLYSRLTETELPHVAIFLNDVQRKGVLPRYGINGTFLSGHFKGYTIKLNPLDGVYYCDIRPNMVSDAFLARHIDTIDVFFYDDLPEIVSKHGLPLSDVAIEEERV